MRLSENHKLHAGEVAYIVTDESKDGFAADISVDLFDTLDCANDEAERLWKHLTAGEKAKRHIWVGIIKAEDCDDGIIHTYDSIWGVEGAFDSEDEGDI